MRISAHRQPNVRWQGKLVKIFCKKRLSPLTVEGRGALTGVRHSCSHWWALEESIHLQKQTMLAGHPHAPLWVRHTEVDFTH